MREGWEYKKLHEVCDKSSSNIVINKLDDNNGDYPLFGASGLVRNVDFYHQDKPYIGIVKDGAGVGRVNTYPAFSSLVGTMQYIFAKDNCLLDYIKYFLIKLDLSHCVSGATIPHIYFKDYGKERIPVPSIDVQQSIVSELDKINELIRLKKEQLKDYDNLAQSIFYEMFGDPVVNEKGWEVKKIGEVCLIERGGSPRPIKDYITEDEDGLNWIKIGDAQEGSIFINSTKEKIRKEGLKKTRMVHKGDFILSNSMSFGRPYIMGVDGCIHDGWLVLHDTNNTFNKLYLYYSLAHKSMYQQFKQMAVGGVVNNLNSEMVRRVLVLVPPLIVQQEFANRIELIEMQKKQIISTIQDLETLLASRMQYWFD